MLGLLKRLFIGSYNELVEESPAAERRMIDADRKLAELDRRLERAGERGQMRRDEDAGHRLAD